MALFLVQHGISASKDVDPGKGLTEEGREQTVLIAQVARGYGVKVSKVVHSGKLRARQTAELFRELLHVESPLEEINGIAPLDDVEVFAERVDPEDNLLVVGHLPFMERLVSFLTAAKKDIKVYQFQNSGLVCLDANQAEDGEWQWYIKWTLNPTIS